MSAPLTAPAAIILAAGQGTRMRSRIPKVLHPVAGRPMILHAIEALSRAGVDRPVVVTGHGAEAVEAVVADRARTVRQERQDGTADAVRVALPLVDPEARTILVTMGDAPLLRPELFGRLVAELEAAVAAIVLVSARMPEPAGYGRLVRDAGDAVRAIVEEGDTDAVTRAIDEVNAGTYAFDAAWLRAAIGRIEPSASGELYLTDLVGLAVGDGRSVRAVTVDDPDDAIGINDRVSLAAADERMRRRIAERHMRAGVTIADPSTTRIDASVEIGQDARIEPWTILEGATVIGEDAVIGPNAHLRDSRVGPRSHVWASVLEQSSVAEDVQVGPYAHLRPGAEVGPRCRIGNFAEIKKSRIGAGTQQHHFSYIGDADIGENVNIGAGSVTANFDGADKHRTVVGDEVKLGVDTMMVAPVTIGEGATTGAGAVVTRDVAPGKTVVGMPARPIEMRRRRSSSGPATAGDAEPRAGQAPVPSGTDRNT
ncbi:MAG TPA: bifunctional UDP-N-acetylglucosamine diphosphorylase/glucosamine-1-phosphate N-acetyltransferase GlmU [Candidatus Limnocylindrales bacterium]|nr:bifunctional UDP-N-acetylglucosamine diphosphorylase/glucosamine-1-phosphate N-acetyltransferase GlmU [Candidatus Limnocylindrales bacterium]